MTSDKGSWHSMWPEKFFDLFKRRPAHDEKRTDDSRWCLVGNIIDSNAEGIGNKHFSPGTKVHCFPVLWGDGYEKIMVIGPHRGSKEFVTMIIDSKWIANWRAKVVYNPEVIRRFKSATFTHDRIRAREWIDKAEVDSYVVALNARSDEK